MSTTIRKALISSFGDVSKISVVTAQLPDPEANHVQVKVIYSGFAGGDINMRQGTYPLQRKAPLTPGYCLVGTVHVNAKGSTKFKQGDLVAALMVYDSEAELANVPEKYLIAIPDGLNLQHVTALILDWSTAYGMLKLANVRSGQKVFIHGMSGACGYALMRLCLMQGATVYGTAAERKHDAIRQVGGNPYSYANTDWILAIKKVGGVQAVFDAIGIYEESYSILSHDGGILIAYGTNGNMLEGKPNGGILGPTLQLLSKNLWSWKRRTALYYITRNQTAYQPNLKMLLDMLEDGKIDVRIRHVFDLEDIQTAHRDWLKGNGIGSVLIKVADEPDHVSKH
jgi:NADPH:quinone reductase-like Zn-dependent oxidoreductase